MSIDVRKVRDRAWHYVGQDTAVACDMTLAKMQQFVAGTYCPSEEQLQKLATRIKLTEQHHE